jgi:hypothetical protein
MTCLSESLIVTHLKKLRFAAGTACSLARKNKDNIPGDIDWDNLWCKDVEYWISWRGETGYRVYIVGAEMGEHHLRRFIYSVLSDRGFPDVRIPMEKYK